MHHIVMHFSNIFDTFCSKTDTCLCNSTSNQIVKEYDIKKLITFSNINTPFSTKQL